MADWLLEGFARAQNSIIQALMVLLTHIKTTTSLTYTQQACQKRKKQESAFTWLFLADDRVIV